MMMSVLSSPEERAAREISEEILTEMLKMLDDGCPSSRVLPPFPSQYPPGHPLKVALMEWRYENGYHIHHPLDARDAKGKQPALQPPYTRKPPKSKGGSARKREGQSGEGNGSG